MIDKDILINDLEMEFTKANSKYLENDEDPFYGGICSALQDVIKLVREQREQFEWINADIVPVTDKYILLSFDNFSSVEIGRYEKMKMVVEHITWETRMKHAVRWNYL